MFLYPFIKGEPMPSRRSIVFVCTGNVFRSLSAERALKSILPSASGIEVSSAGTHADPSHPLRPDVRERLEHWGVDVSDHRPRRLTREILDDADLVVAMNTDHQEFIERQFGLRVPLYGDIADGSGMPFPDLPDVVDRFRERPDEARAFVNASIDSIFRLREDFLTRLHLFLPSQPGSIEAPRLPRISHPSNDL